MNVDVSPELSAWANRAQYQVSQGSMSQDGRTVLWSSGGEVRIFVASRSDGWFQVTQSDRMQQESFLLCASSMTVVERYLFGRLGRSVRGRRLPLLSYPVAPLREGWKTEPVVLDRVSRLALMEPTGHPIAIVGADPTSGNAQLAALSVFVSADLKDVESSFLAPTGRPLFTTRAEAKEPIEEIPDFTGDIDVNGALVTYLRNLDQHGFINAREALVDAYGPAIALLVRSKISSVLDGAEARKMLTLPTAVSELKELHPEFSLAALEAAVLNSRNRGGAVPIEVDDLASLIMEDEAANDVPWDHYMLFTYFGDRRVGVSDFQYLGRQWQPGFLDNPFDIVDRLRSIREAMLDRDGRAWDAGVIIVDHASRRGRLFVFYGEDAEFWDMTPATQKAIAERGLQLIEQA